MNNESLIFMIVYFLSIFVGLLLILHFIYMFFHEESIIRFLKKQVKSK